MGLLSIYLTEEDAFWAWVHLVHDAGFVRLLNEKPFVHTLYDNFAQHFAQQLPELAAHLAKYLIPLEATVHRWFSTLFCYDISPQFVAPLWDLIMFEGLRVCVRIAIVLISLQQSIFVFALCVCVCVCFALTQFSGVACDQRFYAADALSELVGA